MKHLKGFITITDLVSNQPSVTAQVGELSPTSATYRPDNREYVNDDFENIRLSLFSTQNDDGSVFELEPVDPLGQHILEIANYVDSTAKGGFFTTDPQTFLNIIRNDRPQITSQLEIGNMVSTLAGHFYPTYMTWVFEGTLVRIWFSDYAFRHQFDEFTIRPISPIENLNDLHRPYEEISELLVHNPTFMLQQANVIAQDAPYTSLQTFVVEWRDKQGTVVRDMIWFTAMYGIAGNNPDSMARAVREYILENSDFTAAEWHDVHPRLFQPTEFVIVPMWHRFSIPDQTALTGIHSPSIRHREVFDLSLPALRDYDLDHVQNNLIVTTAVYKTLALGIIGGEGNVDDISRFDEKFPDYTPISTNNVDFNRLSPRTQDWMILLHRMLVTAETANEFTQLDEDMSRLRRDGVDFIVASYEDVNYLVVQRNSYLDYFNESDYSNVEQ